MNLILHGSLGDHACYTGLPEAYYKTFGELLSVNSNYPELWNKNSYLDEAIPIEGHRLRWENLGEPADWNIYRPRRVFHELTGIWLDNKDVMPKLYVERNMVPKRIVISDEAGWPTRRGYQFFNKLSERLLHEGYEVVYLRNGNYGEETVKEFSRKEKLNLKETIELLSSAEHYIGYDSGIMHLAAGVGCPQVILLAGTVNRVVAHPNCLATYSACKGCFVEHCSNLCLNRLPDINHLILRTIGVN